MSRRPTGKKFCHPIVTKKRDIGRQNGNGLENVSFHKEQIEKHGQTKGNEIETKFHSREHNSEMGLK